MVSSLPLSLVHQGVCRIVQLLGGVRRLQIYAYQMYSWQAHKIRSEDGQVVAAQYPNKHNTENVSDDGCERSEKK